MKKLVALVFAAACTLVQAQSNSTILIAETPEGDRLLYDVATFRVVQDADKKPALVGVFYPFIRDEGMGAGTVFVTYVSSCINKEGQLFERAKENGVWVTKSTRWWSSTGGKIYDTIGLALCVSLEEKLKQSEPQTPKTDNSKVI